MSKVKISGPAIFMYSAIALTIIATAVCFGLYYGGIVTSSAIKWTGVVSFMILYQFGLRILFGEITNHITFNYNLSFFKRKPFEAKLYRLLHVRSWKDKVLTFNPDKYDFENRTLHQLASTMAKSETDHWFNVLISLFGILFAFIWGLFPVFLAVSILAILFDAQFIVVQRYNRPIVLRLKERREAKQTV